MRGDYKLSKRAVPTHLAIVALLLIALPCAAADAPPGPPACKPAEAACTPKENGFDGHFMLSFGTAWRTSTRSPELMYGSNASAAGGSGGSTSGKNSDDGQMNFDRGDRVATILKGVGDLSYRHDNFVAFVRAKAWSDFLLEDHAMTWGNEGNGYATGQPLNDGSASRLSRFSGAALMDAWVDVGDSTPGHTRALRLGRQTIKWGIPSTIGGGLDQINPQELSFLSRPWYLANERDIPLAAAFGRYALKSGASRAPALPADAIEAFYQFEFKPNVVPACGTFNSQADYIADGCDKIFVGPASDRASLAGQVYGKRSPNEPTSNRGQFGLRYSWLVAEAGYFGLSFTNLHSRRYAVSVLKSTRVGLPLIPGDPSGANVQYFAEYPENIRMYGLTWGFQKKDPLTVNEFGMAAELVYQPNQMIRLNSTDILNAFASNTAATPLRNDANNTAPGAVFHGYDRFRTSQLLIGGSKTSAGILGATKFVVSGELAGKYIHGLPDPETRRYGRSEFYGAGPVNGACTGNDKQCSQDGYVTRQAWGSRAKLALTYNLAAGTTLTPSLAFLYDISGWSHDDSISEGRQGAILGLRSEFDKGRYFLDLQWQNSWGGRYNTSKDRDQLSLILGVQL